MMMNIIKTRQGDLIRPSQESTPDVYGQRIIFNKIIELSPTTYKEEAIHTLEPLWHPDIVATHHFSSNDDLIVFDGCKIRDASYLK